VRAGGRDRAAPGWRERIDLFFKKTLFARTASAGARESGGGPEKFSRGFSTPSACAAELKS
jgi:hypothetical protein